MITQAMWSWLLASGGYPYLIAVTHAGTSPYVSVYPWNGTFGTKFADHGTIPTGAIDAVFGDGHIFLAAQNSPYIHAYQFNGGFGTKAADPSPPMIGGAGKGISHAPSTGVLGIAYAGSRYFDCYPFSGGAFGTLFSEVGTDYPVDAKHVEFSPDGSMVWACMPASPFLSRYLMSGTTSYWSRLNMSTSPLYNVEDASASPDGNHIAIAMTSSPYMQIYEDDPLAAPVIPAGGNIPEGNCYGVAFSPGSDYIAACHNKISVWPWTTGSPGTLGTRVSQTLTVSGQGVEFSPDGNFIAVAGIGSPFIEVYPFTAGVFGTKIADPSTPVAGNGYAIAFK